MFSISVVILQCDFLCEKFAPDKVFWQCLGRYHEELNASPAPKHLRLSQYVWEDEDRIPTEYRFGIIQKSIGTSIHARHTITSELLLNNYCSENNNNAYNFARWKTSEIISKTLKFSSQNNKTIHNKVFKVHVSFRREKKHNHAMEIFVCVFLRLLVPSILKIIGLPF